MYIYYNPNPHDKSSGDCVIRAICKFFNRSWNDVYLDVCIEGFALGEMPSTNRVWGSLLFKNGLIREVIPNTCPNCYTVSDFCEDHRKGRYILSTGSHVVTVVDGDYYDSWDSGREVPIYFWRRDKR